MRPRIGRLIFVLLGLVVIVAAAIVLLRALGFMTRDIVPIAAVLTAFGGTVATLIHTGWSSSEHRQHERQLAFEQRRYEKRAEAYITLLRFTQRMDHRIERTTPFWGRGEVAPELPPDEQQWEVEALIAE